MVTDRSSLTRAFSSPAAHSLPARAGRRSGSSGGRTRPVLPSRSTGVRPHPPKLPATVRQDTPRIHRDVAASRSSRAAAHRAPAQADAPPRTIGGMRAPGVEMTEGPRHRASWVRVPRPCFLRGDHDARRLPRAAWRPWRHGRNPGSRSRPGCRVRPQGMLARHLSLRRRQSRHRSPSRSGRDCPGPPASQAPSTLTTATPLSGDPEAADAGAISMLPQSKALPQSTLLLVAPAPCAHSTMCPLRGRRVSAASP